MSGCSCPPRPDDPAEQRTCPYSGALGQAVDLTTVKALLTEKALRRITGAPYRFCADPACEIVYFSISDVFTVRDVRVPVWQKEAYGARLICYCFGENEADIAREITEHNASLAVERVRDHIAAARCACELRNPRGACCLGDVISAVKRINDERINDERIKDERIKDERIKDERINDTRMNDDRDVPHR